MTWCGIYSLVCRLRILIYLHTIYCLHTYKRIIKLIFNYLSRDTDVILYFNDPGIFTIVMFDLLYTFTRTRWLTIDSLLVRVQQLQFFFMLSATNVWRHERGNKKLLIDEGQTIQWPNIFSKSLKWITLICVWENK
jgi:uncharacterized membrane protein